MPTDMTTGFEEQPKRLGDMKKQSSSRVHQSCLDSPSLSRKLILYCNLVTLIGPTTRKYRKGFSIPREINSLEPYESIALILKLPSGAELTYPAVCILVEALGVTLDARFRMPSDPI